MGRLFAVGDIQGCYAPLAQLLDDVKFDPACDRLWCVGDLVNRGPESLRTLLFLHSIRDSIQIVLGNHDLHLLAVIYGQKKVKKGDDLLTIADSEHSRKLAKWLRKQPLVHYDKARNLAMVHAGIPPFWSIKKALAYSAEVETVLQGEDHKQFYAAMYGNHPARWQDDLSGMERIRTIVNYFTRMRFINHSGDLELSAKEGAGRGPEGYRPWFEFEHKRKKTHLLFGHWAALEGVFDVSGITGLDTGCVWGGDLTLLNVDTGECHYRRL